MLKMFLVTEIYRINRVFIKAIYLIAICGVVLSNVIILPIYYIQCGFFKIRLDGNMNVTKKLGFNSSLLSRPAFLNPKCSANRFFLPQTAIFEFVVVVV